MTPDHDPAGADPAGVLAARCIQALTAAARSDGRPVRLVSLGLEIAQQTAPEDLAIEARIERATRTLVFTEARITANGASAAIASAVFRVLEV